MEFSPATFAVLHAIAMGDQDNADGSITADLINKGLVEDAAPHALTELGTRVYRYWAAAQRLAEIPGATMRQARRWWRCVCADENTGYHVTLTWPPDLVPQQSPRVTGREAFTLTGPAAYQEAERMRRENPDATVGIIPIPNGHHRTGCLGDIPPGQMFVLHSNAHYCLVCAQAVLAERQVMA